MPEQLDSVYVPVEQAVIYFYDRPIIAARLTDDRIVAGLRSLCEALQLDRYGQVQRIRADEVLSEQLLQVQIETEGGPQIMDALTAWAVPTWLTGIKLSRISPEKRPAILAFKRQAADVLYRHFSNRAALPAPESLVPAEPISQPEKPGADADDLTWATYFEGLAAWHRWRADLERWRQEHDRRYAAIDERQAELEDRMESVEEVTRLIPEILDRLGPETLSTEHQATVKQMAKRLNELSGISYATIYGELNAAFHVPRYADIPEARWLEVVAWLRQRVEASERRGGNARSRPS